MKRAKKEPAILSRPEVQDMIQDTLVTLLREACEPAPEKNSEFSISQELRDDCVGVNPVSSVAPASPEVNLGFSVAQEMRDDLKSREPYNSNRIGTALSEAHVLVNKARLEYEKAWEGFNITRPTEPTFNSALNRLHAASFTLMRERDRYMELASEV